METKRASAIHCSPLVDALVHGVHKRFQQTLVDPEIIAAAILLPKMKDTSITDHSILDKGK
jgi:hypothetical protein